MEKLLKRISLQTYTLRDIEDFEERIAAASRAGYKSIELCPPEDKSEEEIKAIVDKYDLTVIAMHVGINLLKSSAKKYADMAKLLGCDTIVVPCGAVKDVLVKNKKECLKVAKTVNKIAEKLESFGIKTVYHNHDKEFTRDPATDERLLDILLEGFGPKVSLELDVYWAKYAGVDPVDAIEQYKDIITHCHLKDMKVGENGEKDAADFTDGVMDFRRMIEMLGEGVEYIVEQDDFPVLDPYHAVRRAFRELDGMAASPINVAVIGLGDIGMTHLGAYIRDPNSRVVAICDNDANWLRNVKIRYDIPEVYTDYHELIKNTEIQAVSVCVPNSLHAEITIAALAAGLNVLVEKPMALNATDARLMLETAKRSGKKLMVVQNQRYSSPVRKIKEMYSEGRMGDLFFVKALWQRPISLIPSPVSHRSDGEEYYRNWYNDKSEGGGVLRDLGVHLLDSIMYIIGFPKVTEAIGCASRNFAPGENGNEYRYTSEDFSAGMIKFENGLTVSLEVSFGAPVTEEKINVDFYGTKCCAKRRGESLKIVYPDEAGNGVEKYEECKYDDFVNINREFVSALLKGEEMPVSPESCIKVLEVLDKLYESSGEILDNK